ncbi:hypothetical protein [Vogesella sp. LIG4]|uniref:hypothetical protein n=1 Tax=Vogesella sp. LIG4 TaxID=1192162 RepID=UPI00081FC698|nr:hypothetical protein [Vogesella sp. LIG4]SCK28182.1 hypothetical protein PSELUDRAFT_3441 [Vogesella sp. LIG4]
MRWLERQHGLEPCLVAALLALLACLAPLALYALALALFGLPHVLSEAAWIRRSYRRQLPGRWWALLLATLLIQALARLAGWQGSLSPRDVAWLDLATLALAFCTVLAAREALRAPWRSCVLALAVAGLLLAGQHSGWQLALLAVLSIAHNFTPLLLAPAQSHWGGRPLRPTLRLLFCLPLCLLLLPWLGWQPFAASAQLPAPGEPAMLGLPSPLAFAPALVLAQCLHYYSVIRLLPGATLGEQAPPARSYRKLLPALAACAALSAYFACAYSDARALYAVAAGAHAWLEWPLILLLTGLKPAAPAAPPLASLNLSRPLP